MEPITFAKAYYVKLGRGNEYAKFSILEGKIRVGWKELTLDNINNWQEDIIMKKIGLAMGKDGLPASKATVARDMNALKKFVRSTPEDVWITFYDSHLYWCRVDGTPMDADDEDSKFRRVLGEWRKCDINGKRLIISQIPGILSKIQGFRAAICSLGQDEVATLRRLLNNQPSEAFRKIESAKMELIKQVGCGLSGLFWKDFEVLVDLIFRNAGWRRVSLVGEMMEDIDLMLEEPITGDLYPVQVKSDATLAEFNKYAEKFSGGSFKKSYFVIHKKSHQDWPNPPIYNDVELVLQEDVAKMVVDSGLVNWLLMKIK